MFKGAPLPNNCPPPEASEPESSLTLFRILLSGERNDLAFQSYRQLFPENKRYGNLCIAYAVSMFTTLEFTFEAYRAALQRNKILGSHIARLVIQPGYGKFELNPVNGHCSCWFYDSCLFHEIECLQIIPIDENS